MANNKTPIMFFNLVLIFSLLVVTVVDSRTISDVSVMKTTESSPTIDAESTTTIGVESTPTIGVESAPTTDSKANSTIDDVPDTIESISIGVAESAPLVGGGNFGGQCSPLGIGRQVFIGTKVDHMDDMTVTGDFVKIVYAKYNYSALFVGKVMTVADTPHNRMILSKRNEIPKENIHDQEV